MNPFSFRDYLNKTVFDRKLLRISEKILNNQRISIDEGMALFEKSDLGLLAFLSNHVRKTKNERKVFFNRNFHIEPTNKCIFRCKFCSYRCDLDDKNAWDLSLKDMESLLEKQGGNKSTEVHITGGVHPDRKVEYYIEVIRLIKRKFPQLQVKAFSAIELDYIFRISGISVKDGLLLMKKAGLDSIPGGGAEIFADEIRKVICPDKANAEKYLEIHEKAHKIGIPSNATILYGHIESYEHRLSHLDRLRKLQDKTMGFNAFIPLKFKNKNNRLSSIAELGAVEDLKNFAISRIFLDNFPHVKAYWPMLGKQNAQMALAFGVDDLDGTINDSTKIYTMAGASQDENAMSVTELVDMIKTAGYIPVERDTFYHELRQF
ncbi:MAG: aminofutalosine synthase MqnE [Bacteroidia bacterium]|nr:MAG: aminofutalosine synthase MqnE [Bacteroidia bacterium]